MKGLLYKDFLQMGSGRKLYLYIGILCGVNSLLYLTGRSRFTGGYMLVLILPMYLVFCALFTIGADRRTFWARYTTATPLPRRRYVQSKYLILLIMSGICLALGAVYTALEFTLAGRPSLIMDGLTTTALHIASLALVSAIAYPFYFWLESEKADSVIGLLVLAPTMLVYVIRGGYLPGLGAIATFFDTIRLPLLLGGLVLAIAGYFLSQALWRRKEL